MPVPAPAACLQVDFDVADFGGRVVELNNGVAKIRSRFLVPKARVNHADTPAVERAQIVAANALMKPNLLQQTLGRNIAAAFAQIGPGMGALTPFLVEMWIEQGHSSRFAKETLAKSRI